MSLLQSRRDLAATLSWAGAAGLLGAFPAFADEAPPETTTIRLAYDPTICVAPLYLADDLLRTEGLTDIHWIPYRMGQVARGEVDIDTLAVSSLVTNLDAGEPITVLAGLHPGCFELFANEPIQNIRDLKGQRVGIPEIGSPQHLHIAIMTAQVGLDPKTDINWVESPKGNFLELLSAGGVDAFLASPPEPQRLHARNIGRVILNTTTEKPWSQYFCCMVYGNREFVQDHPAATKRFLRALLKAADFCADQPAMAARRMVDGKFTPSYDDALRTFSELPYRAWRDYDPADSMRFFALRLREVGMIKSDPNALIAAGTDWRFVEEIKRELKA